MILLYVLIFLFSMETQARVFNRKCENTFSKYSQELSSQLKSGDSAKQDNALDLLWNYGADNTLIRESLEYVLTKDSSEDVHLKAVKILQAHYEKAKTLDSHIAVVESLRRSFNKNPSQKIRKEILDFLGRFAHHEGVQSDFLKMISQEASPLRDQALANVEDALNTYFVTWDDTLTSLTAVEKKLNQKVTKIDEGSSNAITRAGARAAVYTEMSAEGQIFGALLKILRNQRAKLNWEVVVLARDLGILPKPYTREIREKAFDLLETIYWINFLKIKLINILENRTFRQKLGSYAWSGIRKTKKQAALVNQQIETVLRYIVNNEPEINISLIRKSFDFLLKAFKKQDTDREIVFEFLQDFSRDDSRPALLRQKAIRILKDM